MVIAQPPGSGQETKREREREKGERVLYPACHHTHPHLPLLPPYPAWKRWNPWLCGSPALSGRRIPAGRASWILGWVCSIPPPERRTWNPAPGTSACCCSPGRLPCWRWEPPSSCKTRRAAAPRRQRHPPPPPTPPPGPPPLAGSRAAAGTVGGLEGGRLGGRSRLRALRASRLRKELDCGASARVAPTPSPAPYAGPGPAGPCPPLALAGSGDRGPSANRASLRARKVKWKQCEIHQLWNQQAAGSRVGSQHQRPHLKGQRTQWKEK